MPFILRSLRNRLRSLLRRCCCPRPSKVLTPARVLQEEGRGIRTLVGLFITLITFLIRSQVVWRGKVGGGKMEEEEKESIDEEGMGGVLGEEEEKKEQRTRKNEEN
ncbi:hypothetical protein E2C01_073002 [Portunus trituberculatus]|uniref:Uncharacterized protein n=1 Tax=Portunus trituberculatus TaxID=210409 RepID=A0A5B7I8P9_PORTR|nr:hypothetical protein [Portunus trituberculatus]